MRRADVYWVDFDPAVGGERTIAMVTTMRATAKQVAEYFLLLVDEDAGDVMTNLRLQKLVYDAQAWHLAILDEELFDDDCEAWVHGPVIHDLYKAYGCHLEAGGAVLR